MFAVVRTGGKQYRVAAGDKIVVEKLAGNAGDTVTLDDVLLAGEGSDLKSTDGLTVSAEIIAQAKADKVTVFKKRRRHNYRRKHGHRQQHTILRITAIGDQKAPKKPVSSKAEGAAPGKAEVAAPKKVEAAPAPEAKEAAPKKAAAKKEAAAEKPKKDVSEKKASPKAKAEAPKKKEGAASEMTDSPAPAKKKASTKKPATDKNA
jgi:large subunit ribosomal protein L21